MTPRTITVHKELQTLDILWKDGHRSSWPLDGLRKSCPCAGCSGGHAEMGKIPDPEIFRAPPERRWEEVRVSAVGSYAIKITWDDGHDSGIFTWKRLRQTCPCDACASAG